MNIDEIRKRHEEVEAATFVGFPEAYGEDAHQDRGVLLTHVAEQALDAALDQCRQYAEAYEKRILEAQRDDAQRVMREACEANKVFRQRIAELEATLDPRVQPALAHLVPAVPEGAVVEEVRVIYRNVGELQSVAMMANQTPDADTALGEQTMVTNETT